MITKQKMIRNVKYILAFGFVFGLIACETKLEIEMPEPEPKLVMNSLFTPFVPPYPKSINVQLWGNAPILDTTVYDQIKDAEILWFENGIFIDTLKYEDKSKSYASPILIFAEVGKEYSVVVSKEGYPPISAACIVPQKVNIDSLSIIALAGIDDENSAYSSVTLIFHDPENEENYYDIILSDPGKPYQLWTSEQIITQEAYYPSDLALEQEKPKRLLFNDSTFDGEEKTIVFYYEPPQQEDYNVRWISTHIVYIELRSVTKDYYTYFTSVIQNQNSRKGDLFYGLGEPVNACTNVENGYGIFSGYHVDGQSINIDSVIF